MVDMLRRLQASMDKIVDTQVQMTDDADFAAKYGIQVADVAQIRAVTGSALTEINATFLTQLGSNYN